MKINALILIAILLTGCQINTVDGQTFEVVAPLSEAHTIVIAEGETEESFYRGMVAACAEFGSKGYENRTGVPVNQGAAMVIFNQCLAWIEAMKSTGALERWTPVFEKMDNPHAMEF